MPLVEMLPCSIIQVYGSTFVLGVSTCISQGSPRNRANSISEDPNTVMVVYKSISTPL